jgi:hypothetical protein
LEGEHHIPRWQRVNIFTLVSAIRTCPEPTIFAFFHGFNKVFADFVGRCLRIAVLRQDDFSEFFLIPVVTLFLLLFFLLYLACIGVQ